MTETCVIAATGDYADFQHLDRIFEYIQSVLLLILITMIASYFVHKLFVYFSPLNRDTSLIRTPY